MDDEKKQALCVIGEMTCEALMGGAIGITVGKLIKHTNCTKGQSLVVTLGTAVGSWLIGRRFAKEYYKTCDYHLGTDFMDE